MGTISELEAPFPEGQEPSRVAIIQRLNSVLSLGWSWLLREVDIDETQQDATISKVVIGELKLGGTVRTGCGCGGTYEEAEESAFIDAALKYNIGLYREEAYVKEESPPIEEYKPEATVDKASAGADAKKITKEQMKELKELIVKARLEPRDNSVSKTISPYIREWADEQGFEDITELEQLSREAISKFITWMSLKLEDGKESPFKNGE